jgi:hypothetical protein
VVWSLKILWKGNQKAQGGFSKLDYIITTCTCGRESWNSNLDDISQGTVKYDKVYEGEE